MKLFRLLFEDESYGKYLFGQERNLPNAKKPEKDTDEESKLFTDLHHHYQGEPEELNQWINKLVKLKSQGKYLDVLAVPSKYKYAYRMMTNIKHSQLVEMLGYDPQGVEPGEIYEEKETITFYPKTDRDHYSWTVNFDRFEDMLQDWERYTYSPHGYLVFLKAPIAGNTFLLNPDVVGPIAAEQYAYQQEVISVGPVKCEHIWYVSVEPKNKKEEFYAGYKRLVDIDRSTTQHVIDYETQKQRLEKLAKQKAKK